MSNYSIYRTGWDVDADEARSDAKSSVKSDLTDFNEAVPQEINIQVLRMQQHMRMYEKLYGVKPQVQEEPAMDAVHVEATQDKEPEALSEHELEIIQTLGASVENDIETCENGNIGDEQETQEIPETVLLGEGKLMQAVKEKIKEAVHEKKEKTNKKSAAKKQEPTEPEVKQKRKYTKRKKTE